MTKVAFEEIVRFGAFELDLEREELRRHGEAVAIQPQPMRALTLLVTQGGKLVSREQMQLALWGETPYLDVDRSLNHTIRKLRLVLDDDARSPSLIQTVPRRGYRFIGKTETMASQGEAGARASSFDGRPLAAAAGDRFEAPQILPRPEGDGPIFLSMAPFRDIPGESSWPGLADGVVEELISVLVRLQDRRLVVIDAGVEAAASSEAREPASAPRAFDFLLRGTVRLMGGSVRVHAHLVQRSDGRVVGTAVFEEHRAGLFELQRGIADRIVSSLIEPLIADPEEEDPPEEGPSRAS
ncbi:MAG: winged helix-turn-helix domain-containing protein [Acidobacteriota bacterium]